MIPPGMRLVVIAVSCFGSFGGEAQSFFAEIGRRVGGGVPYSLLDEASWAVPRFAPFIRMALGCAARRGMAESVWRLWRRISPAPDRPGPAPPQGTPPPLSPSPPSPPSPPALVGVPSLLALPPPLGVVHPLAIVPPAQAPNAAGAAPSGGP